MSDILNGLLQKAYNLPENEVAALLYKADEEGNLTTDYAEDALEKILAKDAERIASLKPKPVDTTELYNKAVKETEGKIHSKWEEGLRSAFPTVDPERKLQGEALRKAIAEFKAPAELPDVKSHPDFLKLEADTQRVLSEKEAEWQQKFQEQEQQFIQRQQWEGIASEIRKFFFQAGFVIPKGKEEAHFQDFLPKFEGYKFQKNADGTTLVLNPDGTRVENAHGHPIFLHDLVLLTGKNKYDVEVQPKVGSAGNDNTGKLISHTFKDENDFLTRYTAEKDPEVREAMAKAFEAQQK